MLATFAQAVQDQGSGTSTFELVLSIASIVGLWKMFEKAGQPGWPSLIPFYNIYKLCEVTMGFGWYCLRLLLFCIPVIGWIAGFYFLYQICKATAAAYGKPESWAWGYLFLSPIFYCITGFGDAEYYGPMGAGDNRTRDAKQSRTVNFDVVKNEPVQKAAPAEPTEPVAREEEETVDFIFDQPEE